VYDPLLVRYLAEELDRAIGGRACAAAPVFSADFSVVLPLERGRALRLDLHPTRGWTRMVEHARDATALDSRCTGVSAPADERILVIGLAAPDRFGGADRRLIVELHTNQWNALVVSDDDGRIVSALRARTAGGRELHPGDVYEPPRGSPRFGAAEVGEAEAWTRWREQVGDTPPAERRAKLLREFAWLGAVNVDAVLGHAGSRDADEALRDAFERWWAVRGEDEARPVLVTTPAGVIPYPFPLPGLDSEPVRSLLEGMERVVSSGAAGAVPRRTAVDPDLLQAVERRARSLERRVRSLEAELAGSGEAERLRAWGDLLLSKLHEVPRGAERAELTGWDGEAVTIPLDPSLATADNATRLYEEARKRSRAEARLPALLEVARAEAARWRAALDAAASGELPDWARAELARSKGGSSISAADGSESRPYRVFRTSGGLEVRVGRSARANDRLTFGNSSPNDVWLHAQSVPGSHVILRWPSADEAPPARDLEEAAVLAARYSRARTSAVVAVDWTRRKHVRKPRGAPPGSVVIQRAKTVFVEPDPAVEERMAAE
jgi:predicted ribosome quality control (RQC) complex YloA/Tae2 family protein